MAQQRDTIREISPPWLASGTGERYLYNFGLSADVLLEKLNQGMRAHLPGAGTSSALVYIGNDRVIPRGPYESDAQYIARLKIAYESWQRAGARRAVLGQVLSYLSSPDSVNDGKPSGAITGGVANSWDVYYAGDSLAAPPAHIRPIIPTFNWDGDSTQWWRAWLILYFAPVALGRTGAVASMTSAGGFATVSGLTGMNTADVGRVLVVTGAATAGHNGALRIEQYISPTVALVSCGQSAGADANNGAISWSVKSYPTIKPGPAWGSPGMTWGDLSRSWGLANPPGTVAGILSILREWQSAHSLYPETMLIFSGGTGAAGYDMSPYSTPGAGNPDGNWAHFSKYVAGASVPARVFTGTDAGVFGKFNCFCGGSEP